MSIRAGAERLAAFIVLASAAVLGTATTARAADVSCGDFITASVVLDRDLSCPGSQRGVTVVGDGTTFDLHGHSITGSPGGTGVVASGTNVTVKNGTITGFTVGLRASNASPGAFEHLTLTANGTGGMFIDSSAVLRNSQVSRNDGDGLYFSFNRPGGVFDSTIAHNGGNGIFGDYGSDAATYQGNRVVGNGGHGIDVETATSTILDNVVLRNGRDGIHAYESVGLDFAKGYLIGGNMADGNAGLGISACINDRSTEVWNPCAPGMIDGGGNSAKHNGDPRQCLNIVCAFNRGRAAKGDQPLALLHGTN
jgi:parallel beta helix pectate lyase-like protein